MDQEELEYTPTTFDIETQSKNLQILTTFIPYMEGGNQKNFAVLVKFMELRNVITIFNQEPSSLSMCSYDDSSEKAFHLLNDIKKFCTPAEQDSIDMMMTAFQMFSSYDTMFHATTE